MNYSDYLDSKRKVHGAVGPDVTFMPSSLFPFQDAVVRWGVGKGRACLFAATGMGKSRMQVSWAMNMPGPRLLLAPLAVGAQTIREAKAIGVNAGHLGSSADIEVVNYDRLEQVLDRDWQTIVCDESSVIKDFAGKTTVKLQGLCSRIPYRLFCSATPAPNDYMELGTHAEIVGAMTRAEMLATFFTHDLETTSAWRLKRHAVKDFWEWVSTWAVCFAHPREIGFDMPGYDLPPLTIKHIVVEDDADPMAGWKKVSATSLHRTGSSTIGKRANVVRELMAESPGKWLVWCHTNNEQDALEAVMPGVLSVRGNDSVEHKESSVLEFCDGPNSLLSKPSITGHGLNFQCCHQMIFAGVTFSFESMYQAIRRCWRFGQKEPVTVYVLAPAAHARVLETLSRKEEAFNQMRESMRQFAHVKELNYA